jgi:hypothetical protein
MSHTPSVEDEEAAISELRLRQLGRSGDAVRPNVAERSSVRSRLTWPSHPVFAYPGRDESGRHGSRRRNQRGAA